MVHAVIKTRQFESLEVIGDFYAWTRCPLGPQRIARRHGRSDCHVPRNGKVAIVRGALHPTDRRVDGRPVWAPPLFKLDSLDRLPPAAEHPANRRGRLADRV